MICHKHKCIFIHIPRTAGTSIEKAIVGVDWWEEEPRTKHIIASTAKRIYADYWQEYFKFSFIRNPFTRVASMGMFPTFYGVQLINGKLDLEEYLKAWNSYEIDPRSESHLESLPPAKQSSIYDNILNEDLDFIGRFENLQNDFDLVAEKIGLKNTKLPHIAISHINNYAEIYTDKTKAQVVQRYGYDIAKYGYTFPA